MTAKSATLYARLLGSASAITLLSAGVAYAEPAQFSIESQPLAMALNIFSEQSGRAVLLKPELAGALASRGVAGSLEPEIALAEMLQGTGLTYKKTGDTFLIVQGGSSDPQGGSAAGGGATVEALIVTAQKREEDIQDVPIAISAFSQEDLTNRQVAGGPDLITQVPNFTFTKTNFSSYSIQIRGIGTQAISATTDAAVAVAFNNTPFIRNRFFEQEFYDLERVEVLRGPQGTLYGRNATAGAVNIITAKPKFFYEARLAADVANYNSSRLEGMVNIPLVEDAVALRLAGAWTRREGFVTNEITGNPIDGRNLWSTRLSLRFTPNDRIDANLIWEHFDEDDDRLRSGKQLCKTDEITEFAGFPTGHYQSLPEYGQSLLFAGVQGSFSQGCAPNSLYDADSFQTPNGIALPYYLPLSAVFLPAALDDPYVSRTQSRDLRVIESTVDPEYRAKTDIFELQVNYDLTDTLTLTSETAYSADTIFSQQDFNRFNTAPGAWEQGLGSLSNREGVLTPGEFGGIFCDPQLGCSDRLVAVDLSTANSRQFSQEFRVSSNYDGTFNFSLGGNFLRYDTVDKYYVFINSLSLISAISPYGTQGTLSPYEVGVTDNSECLAHGAIYPDPNQGQQILNCTYMDPNPIGALNDNGHNYFLSKNPYKLISYAVFGEAYYNVTDNLKITAGLRWTVDKKEAPLIPSWVLASNTFGYPIAEVVEQEWREPTGRLTVDWKPNLSFTDETLLYASYAHGYKAGGANPPTYGKAIYSGNEIAQILITESATHPKTFDPEFVDAFEIGTKNTLLDGRMTLNANVFYYDYQGYQISQIVDRSATNMNFDATVWGVELEADWRPVENLRFGLKLGYENTKVADGEQAIDIMDRTAGHDAWTVYRPFPSIPSNCVLPKWLFVGHRTFGGPYPNPELVNVGGRGGGNPGGCELAYVLGIDPATNATFTPYPGSYLREEVDYPSWSTNLADYPGWPTDTPITVTDYPGWDPTIDYGNNHGEGFFKDLSGNELPNAPHYTATLTTDYTIPLAGDWLVTLHSDLYYQSEAWTRIFNMEGYDKLKAYTNVNLAAIFTNEPGGWKVMAYVKNVMDRDSITGAFLNSDDTGLTTNVFLTEPRLYGLRVTKEWTGGPLLGGFGQRHDGPYAVTVELGGMVQRTDASNDPIAPSFAGLFSDDVYNLDEAQDRDLDWGDEREARVTYRLPSSLWSVSAAYRAGRANNATTRLRNEEQSGDLVCLFGPPLDAYCAYSEKYYVAGLNWSDATARSREEHHLIDFTVGRDVGFGGVSRSTVSAGLRYAQFKSDTQAHMDGVPDDYVPAGFFTNKYPATHERYQSTLNAHRDFKGVGPVLTWDASARLLGGGQQGHVDVDWSLGGGVLFGKQKVHASSEEDRRHYDNYGLSVVYGWAEPTYIAPTQTFSLERSKSVTAPVFSASLGLSYAIDRMRVSTGYRWERYFDIIDGGADEAKKADRTLDGPYFKLSVGFGG